MVHQICIILTSLLHVSSSGTSFVLFFLDMYFLTNTVTIPAIIAMITIARFFIVCGCVCRWIDCQIEEKAVQPMPPGEFIKGEAAFCKAVLCVFSPTDVAGQKPLADGGRVIFRETESMLQRRGVQQSADLRDFKIRLAEGEDGEEGGGDEIGVFDGAVRHGVVAFQRTIVENGLDGGGEFGDVRSHDDDVVHGIVMCVN